MSTINSKNKIAFRRCSKACTVSIETVGTSSLNVVLTNPYISSNFATVYGKSSTNSPPRNLNCYITTALLQMTDK